ncbi:MAG: hypothetical protein ACRETM_02645 [Stenotrophobium sp.]
MRNAVTLLLALILAANGLLMLAAPEYWYQLIPGVPDTGPFNPHFVRDIGCAYLVSGGAFLWLLRDARARSAAQLAAIFLTLHALTHVWDGLAGRETLDHLIDDIPGVFVLPALALWLSWTQARTN